MVGLDIHFALFVFIQQDAGVDGSGPARRHQIGGEGERAAGIEDIVCKVHGTRNYQNIVRAVFDGLKQLESIEDYAGRRDKEAGEVLQARH